MKETISVPSPLDQVFLDSKQESKRLEIALSRFFGEEPVSPSMEAKYASYLSLRKRPALLFLVKTGNLSVLRAFAKTGWMDDFLRLEALRLSADLGHTEMTAFLLQSKAGSSNRQAPVKQISGSPSSLFEKKLQTSLKILDLERIRLYEQLPSLSFAAFDLKPVYSPSAKAGTGTDGMSLFFAPSRLFSEFLDGRLHHCFFHMLFHCLYLHTLPDSKADPNLWNLACDLFVTRLLDRMFPGSDDAFRKRNIFFETSVFREVSDSAEKIYWKLQTTPEFLASVDPALYQGDFHKFWYPDTPDETDGRCLSSCDGNQGMGGSGSLKTVSQNPSSRLQHLESIRKHWLLHASTPPASLKRPLSGISPGSRLEALLLEKKGRYDFRQYLKRFATTHEELLADPGAFDYIPYYYGITHYHNMPFIEPSETSEAAKVQELVIAIDTSGSCSLPVVQRFLEETCSILTDHENFFSRMNVHILQCDSMIQEHTIITCPEDWRAYASSITISGRGGTDFTPVFSFVEKLLREKKLKNLKGLFYFTDGNGIYPSIRPDYETAFVFTDYQFFQYKIPSWIIPLCLDLQGEGNEVLTYEHSRSERRN